MADKVANECYDAMNYVQTFFRDIYGWDSLDDKNMPLVATVHAGYNMANAFFFSGYKQMVFGNRNAVMYDSYRSLDVVGHEPTHGIIQFLSGMRYSPIRRAQRALRGRLWFPPGAVPSQADRRLSRLGARSGRPFF